MSFRNLPARLKEDAIVLTQCIAQRAPRIKLNREKKNFSRHTCNLRLMETSLYSPITSSTILLEITFSNSGFFQKLNLKQQHHDRERELLITHHESTQALEDKHLNAIQTQKMDCLK